MNEEQKAFTRGAACAIACIIHGHGIGTETEEAFRASVGSWEAFMASEPDQFDVDILAPHFKTAPATDTGKNE